MQNHNNAKGGGAGGTLLTGNQGINTEDLNLGKNTLLGGLINENQT